MSFALAVVHLDEALHQEGCPICRLRTQAARRAVDAFLWENVNDVQARQPLLDAYGLCPEHTRLLAAVELRTSGPALGVNIIYEQLGRRTAEELRRLNLPQPSAPRWLRWLRQKLGITQAPVLPARNRCPLCIQMEQSDLNNLHTLFETLEAHPEQIWELYRVSDGLCLAHLRQGLECHAAEFPAAAQRLRQDAIQRMEANSEHMREYLRKNNWEYRAEPISPEEGAAWRRQLTLFTGYPGSRFTIDLD